MINVETLLSSFIGGKYSVVNVHECEEDLLNESSCTAILNKVFDSNHPYIESRQISNDKLRIVIDYNELVDFYNNTYCRDDCECINCQTVDKFNSRCSDGCKCINCSNNIPL